MTEPRRGAVTDGVAERVARGIRRRVLEHTLDADDRAEVRLAAVEGEARAEAL